jgi:hypothetical protein
MKTGQLDKLRTPRSIFLGGTGFICQSERTFPALFAQVNSV